jgi:hypothetical protein
MVNQIKVHLDFLHYRDLEVDLKELELLIQVRVRKQEMQDTLIIVMQAWEHQAQGLEQDTATPAGLQMWVNGVDRTGALGGPWLGSGGAGTFEVDITQWIESVVPLQQEHFDSVIQNSFHQP